jgi:hypothetical protein
MKRWQIMSAKYRAYGAYVIDHTLNQVSLTIVDGLSISVLFNVVRENFTMGPRSCQKNVAICFLETDISTFHATILVSKQI